MTELVPYQGKLSQTRHFINLDEEKQRAWAVQACRDYDFGALWEVVQAHLNLRAKGGVNTSERTLRTYRYAIKHFVDYASKNAFSILKPRRDDAHLYLNHCLAEPARHPKSKKPPEIEKPTSPATVNLRLAGVRLLYRALIWVEATHKNPFDGVGAQNDPTAPIVKNPPYTEQELNALLGHADRTEDRALLLLVAHAGLRISEAMDLRWDDLDHQRGLLRVNKGKGSKAREVPTSGTLRAALQELREEALPSKGFVIPYRHRSHAHRRIENVFLKAESTGSKVKFRGMHAFRKLAATKLLKTQPLEKVKSFLGHQDLSTTLQYTEVNTESIRTEIDTW